jgi:hypothetical protein
MRLRSGLRGGESAPISLFAFQDIIFAATGIFLLISILMTLFGKVSMIATEAIDESSEMRLELEALAEQQLELTNQLKALQINGSLPEAGSGDKRPSSVDALNPWLYDIRSLQRENVDLRRSADQAYQQLTQSIMSMNRSEHRLELLQSGAYLELIQSGQAILRDGKAHDFRELIFILVQEESVDICYPGRPDLRQTFESLDRLLAHVDEAFSSSKQMMLLYLKPSGIKRFFALRDALRKRAFQIGYEPVTEDFDLQ